MLLTIFTPTYNRGNKLEQVYKSLKKQANDEWEWLIVDDGSIDDTEKVVSEFCREGHCNIRYIKKENGGKHSAHNLAVDVAKGNYFMCLDSDDFLQEQAILKVSDFINNCVNNEGIIAYKCDKSSKLLSDEFPSVNCVNNIYTLGNEYGCRGEFTLIFPTHILQKNKFPVFHGEKFITESVLYDRLNCPMRLFPEVIEVCEYQAEGLSNNLNRIMKDNPTGYCLYFMQRIDLTKSFIKKISMAGKYNCFKIICKNHDLKYCGKNKLLVHCTKPIGLLFLGYYKLKRGF